jgi:hypothetical protein
MELLLGSTNTRRQVRSPTPPVDLWKTAFAKFKNPANWNKKTGDSGSPPIGTSPCFDGQVDDFTRVYM